MNTANMAGRANLAIYCRATIEAAVRDILETVAMDTNQPLMEAGLDSLGMPAA